MSRLLDRIKECTRVEAQPMGFRVARKAARLCPIVVARLTAPGIKNLKERVDGADAVMAPTIAIEDVKGLDVIWGARLDDGTVDEVSKAGGDFVVFKAEETELATDCAVPEPVKMRIGTTRASRPIRFVSNGVSIAIDSSRRVRMPQGAL